MTVIKTRKVHTSDFKAKLGLEALSAQKTINEIAQSYGVHPVQVEGKRGQARIRSR